MLSGALGASLFGSISIGEGFIQAGDGFIQSGEEVQQPVEKGRFYPSKQRSNSSWTGLLRPFHPLTNFETQSYCPNKPKFIDVYSKNNLPNTMKDGGNIINLDEFRSIRTIR